MTPRFALVVGAAAIMLAAGCGDDDDDAGGDGGDVEVSEEAQPYVDAMIEGIVEGDTDELEFDEEQAECLAPRWVETFGVDRLQQAGIEPEDFASDADPDLSAIGLSEDEGNEIYDALGSCGIDLRSQFIDSIAEDQDLSEEDAECLNDAFSDDFLRQVMVISLVEGDDALEGNEELTGELLSALAECPGAVDISED